jgi:hypothetical protein
MLLKKILIPALCATAIIAAAIGVWAQAALAPKAVPQAAAQLLDQRALDALKTMSDTISQAKTVRFQARSMVPIRTPDGVWINLYGTSQVVMQGPDKLFATTSGDFAARDFYYNGKTITSYSPDKNLYAVKEAPPTVDAMIEDEHNKYGKSFPYANILISEPYAVMTKGLTRALYIGQSTIVPLSAPRGVKTDHFLFSNKGVEWQIWIDAGDHLPRLVVATYLDDASEPSYSVEFGDWKLNEPVDPTVFTFNNALNASKVEFRDPAVMKQEGR